MNITQLHNRISAVAPIHGIDSSGGIQFKDTATVEEIELANGLMYQYFPTLSDEPTPTCTPWQIAKALNRQGLLQAVEAAIAVSENIELRYGWERATEFRSDDPFVISMGTSLGKTEEETTNLIRFASTL